LLIDHSLCSGRDQRAEPAAWFSASNATPRQRRIADRHDVRRIGLVRRPASRAQADRRASVTGAEGVVLASFGQKPQCRQSAQRQKTRAVPWDLVR
jgi:hypothetical protein